jgi:release factor glutamine methyltransferase
MTALPGSCGTVLLDAVATAARQLAAAGVDSPRTNAELIAAHVHQVPRGQLHRVRDAGFDSRFWELVERRADGEPLQHITGRAYFRYLELDVGPGVFVPRPETEVMTGWAVGWLRAMDRREAAGPVAVDLGTGSGAIALAIAQEVPQARVHAVEAERLALAWAERNVSRNPAGSRVTLHHTALTNGAGGSGDAGVPPELGGAVDLVISNPPYIPDGSWVAPEVGGYDPPEALWGGPDGLDVIRVVERAARRLLRPGGVAAVEHGAPQGAAVRQVFARAGGWQDITTCRDLAGRDRFVTAVRAPEAVPGAAGEPVPTKHSPERGRMSERGRDDTAI